MEEVNLSLIKTVCQQLKENDFKTNTLVPPLSKQNESNEDDQENIIIERVDYENLINFVELYTDALEIEDVQDQYEDSEFETLQAFETANNLYNLGFFYVKVDMNCSTSEFLGLIERIPLEQFCIPGTLQVPFPTLTELFGNQSEKLIMKLMVLGYHFKYWELINPYANMKKTNENTKLVLSGMGNLTILITPKYIKNCVELLQNINSLNKKQVQSFSTK